MACCHRIGANRWSTILISVAAVLQRNEPAVAALLICMIPLACFAPFLDAWPEKTRRFLTFTFCLIHLIVSVALIAGLLTKVAVPDEYWIPWLGRDQAYPMSSLMYSAMGSLVPFVMKNLIVAVWRPSSLVVLTSRVVSAKVDRCVFEVLQLSYDLLSKEGAASSAALVAVSRDSSGERSNLGSTSAPKVRLQLEPGAVHPEAILDTATPSRSASTLLTPSRMKSMASAAWPSRIVSTSSSGSVSPSNNPSRSMTNDFVCILPAYSCVPAAPRSGENRLKSRRMSSPELSLPGSREPSPNKSFVERPHTPDCVSLPCDEESLESRHEPQGTS